MVISKDIHVTVYNSSLNSIITAQLKRLGEYLSCTNGVNKSDREGVGNSSEVYSQALVNVTYRTSPRAFSLQLVTESG